MASAQEKDRADARDEGPNDLHTKLETAFRNLPNFRAVTASEEALRLAVGFLAYLSTYKEPSSLSQFRKVGRKAAMKELDHLAVAAEMLIARFEALSATAISALGGERIMIPIERQKDYLRDLAAVARSTDVNGAPDAMEKGRPPKKRVIGAARIIIEAFETITGENADLPANRANPADDGNDKTRGLKPLVKEIFSMLGIKANAKNYTDAALAERKAQREQNMPDEQLRAKGITSEEFWERMRRTELAECSPRFWKSLKNTSPKDH